MEKSIFSVVVQLIQSLLDSLKVHKASVLVENEDVHLTPSAACFATMTLAGTPNNPFKQSFDYFPSAPSVFSEIPSDLVQRLRCVSFTRPDIRVISEVFLVANGFTTAAELSEAMCRLQGLCETFIPSFGCGNTQLQSLPACMAKGSGWSIMCVKKIINDAGNNLYDTGVPKPASVDSDAQVLTISDSISEEVQAGDDYQGLCRIVVGRSR